MIAVSHKKLNREIIGTRAYPGQLLPEFFLPCTKKRSGQALNIDQGRSGFGFERALWTLLFVTMTGIGCPVLFQA
jgi:hypothetical protein